jgi:predicted ATP-grasp superfamily ATP-dependent carboligase
LYADSRKLVTSALSQRLLLHSDLADIPAGDMEIPPRSPIVSILARGASVDAVTRELESKARQLQQELASADIPVVGSR